MQNLVIDAEFRDLLPRLDKETYALLEENIIQNGCRDSIVIWGDIIVDGNNRFAICSEHDIPFNTISKEFVSREDALIWIISTQVSRRNLTPIQLSFFRGTHYRADRKVVGNRSGNNQFSEECGQNDHIPNALSTSSRLGQQYRVSPKTIRRDARVAETIAAIGEISQEAKRMILSGDVSVDKKFLERLSSASKEDIAELAEKIEDGTYERRPVAAVVSASGNEDLPLSAQWAREPALSGGGFGSDASVSAEMRQLESAIGSISNDYFSTMQRLSKATSMAEFRGELRSYINTLEDLYQSIC